MPKTDVLVMIIVTAITIISHNLAIAVIIGMAISALNFAWQHTSKITATSSTDEKGSKTYHLQGILFYGSTGNFEQIFDIKNDPEKVIVDFQNCIIKDMSSLEILHKITSKYSELNKQLSLKNLDKTSEELIKNAEKIIKLNIHQD